MRSSFVLELCRVLWGMRNRLSDWFNLWETFLNAAHNFTHLQLFCSSRYPVFPHKCIIKILFISYFLHIMYAYMSRVFRHWIDCMVLCTYTLPNEYLMNSSGNDIKENWILCFMHIYFEGYWRISNLIFHWRFFVFFVCNSIDTFQSYWLNSARYLGRIEVFDVSVIGIRWNSSQIW